MKFLTISLLLLITISCSNNKHHKEREEPAIPKASTIWPNKGWQHQPYSEANINGSILQSIKDSIPEKHSLLIIKDGYIVHESYQAPYHRDSLIHINSCTKSVIAILFGMVFKDQLSQHENKSAISYFPEYQFNDSSISQIKVKHFLSMSSGLQWKGGVDAADVIAMSKTDDWAKYVFHRKKAHQPGEEFHYNSGGSQVVSSILDKTIPNGLANYAKDSLFAPLGISDYTWAKTSKGVLKAGWGLQMKMHDMAKLGYLLLNKGKWEEQQVLPKAWVNLATSKKLEVNDQYDYGYQFWIFKNIGLENYLFRGSYPPSTKIISILPTLNTVVVYIGEYYGTNELLSNFILPALKNQSIGVNSNY